MTAQEIIDKWDKIGHNVHQNNPDYAKGLQDVLEDLEKLDILSCPNCGRKNSAVCVKCDAPLS